MGHANRCSIVPFNVLSFQDEAQNEAQICERLSRIQHRTICQLMRESNTIRSLISQEHTLFSPIDSAFTRMSKENQNRLINDAEFRRDFIRSHLIKGRIRFDGISSGQQLIIHNLNGQKLHLIAYPNGFVVNGARVLQADLQLSNTASWMNSVDRILIDSSHNQSVEQHLAAKHPQLNRWFQSAGHDLVEPNQEFTVFAPTDQAFRDLPWPLAERLYVNRNLLRDLLANHIVPGIHYSVGLLNRSVRARSGLLLHTTLTNDQLQVNGIDLIDRDLVVQHGVVHPIRQVLLSAEVLRDCNCLEPAELSDIVNRVKNNRAPANSTREARYVSPLVHSRDRLNVNEHFKRHFRNLTNLAYESKNQTKPLKPMVIYDQSDAWPYQTAGSSSARRFQPVAYHTNHNYADLPLSSSALPDGRLYVHEFYNSSNSRNQSILNRNIDLNLSPPALPLYNPFMPIRNYTLQHHHAPYAGISFPLDPPTNLNPPPLPPAFSPRQPSYQILPVSIIDAAQLSPSQFKFLNDLTTPTSIHFDPTRRPKQLRTDPILINHPRLEPMEPQSSARLQTNPQPRLNPMEAQLAYYPTKSPTRPASNTEAPKSAAVMLTLNEVIREPRLELDGHPARFAIFEHLLNQSGLNGLTTGNSQVSLFLPNDQAFLRLTRTQRLLLGITSRRMRNKRDQDSIDRLRQSNLIRHLILSHISPVLVRPTSIDRKGISIEAFSNYSLHLHRQGSALFVNNVAVRASTLVSNGVIYVVNELLVNLTKMASDLDRASDRIFYSRALDLLNTTTPSISIRRSFGPLINTTSIQSSINRIDQILQQTRRPSLIEHLHKHAKLSRFTELILKSNYSRILNSGIGKFTLLVPENEAFDLMRAETLQNLTNNQRNLNRLIANHLIAGNWSTFDLLYNASIRNQIGKPLIMSQYNQMLVINSTALIRQENVNASQSLIHVISNILIPDLELKHSPTDRSQFARHKPLTDDWGFEAELRSLAYQWNSTQYTTMLLQSTIVRSMLDQSENNFTLILPTDHAYHSLPERMRQRIQDELDRRTNLLQYHVLSGLDLLNQSQAFNRLSAESGVPLFYTNLTQLHQITNQSFRPSTSSSTPNTAFSSTRAHLPSFNVIPSTASADQAEAARLLAKIDQINRSPGHASVSGSLILSAKLLPVFRTRPSHSVLPYATPRARYVLVLSVDRVLYPPRNSVFDMVTAAPMLSTLADLLRVSGLASALQSDLRPLTLFAPSNNAFNQLGQATLDQLRRNPETTRAFLTRHLLGQVLFTSTIPANGTVAVNAAGEVIELQKQKEIITIDGVSIEFADITATNGVVHVLAEVL